jgi:hypothetical protein
MHNGLSDSDCRVLETIARNNCPTRTRLRSVLINERWERPARGFWDGLDRAIFRMRGYDRHAQELDSSLRRLEQRGYIRRSLDEDEFDECLDTFMLTLHGRGHLYGLSKAARMDLIHLSS